jgi:stage II sporulation protein D
LVSPLEGAAAENTSEISLLPAGQTAQPLTAAKDRGRAVRLQKTDGETVTLTMEDYLWGVVAAEMPASFAQEALNAQACAARTYTVLRQNAAGEKHPGADICGDSTCCQAWTERSAALERWGLDAAQYSEKISRAVADTDGLGILYEGAPIQALFFSSAPGKTTDAVEVWGNAVDYLKSVDSPEGEEVPNYHSQVTLSPQDVKELTLSAYPGANLSGTPDTWFGTPVRSGAAAVSSVTLGGVTLTGSQVRSLFSLRSAAFSVQYDGENFVFDVIGYGHGVGMSQYGANAMAQQGSDFREILTWYYTGTQVGELW